MRPLPTKKYCSIYQDEEEEEEEDEEDAAEEETAPREVPTFFQCSELILPWLTSSELAAVSLTCKFLHQLSKSITLRRSSDASRSFESLPIPFANAIDAHPYADFIYTPSQLLPPPPNRQPWGSDRDSALGSLIPFGLGALSEVRGCDCRKCGSDCPCLRLEGLEEVANECGPSLGCELGCGNRASQGGVSIRLKVVRDVRKGWSLLADQIIKIGQFVCEYADELVTTEEARRRHQLYDELSSNGRFSSALLVVREHLPSGKACLRLNIDATRVGNVSRFINHSCDRGNLSTVLVRSTGSLLPPRLCFFASKDTEQGEELSFSYGEARLGSTGLPCFCGTSSSCGLLPPENT